MILECGSAPIVAIAVGRIVVGITVSCWIVGTIVVVVTTSINSVVGVVGSWLIPDLYKISNLLRLLLNP